jgi:hypothetical protein
MSWAYKSTSEILQDIWEFIKPNSEDDRLWNDIIKSGRIKFNQLIALNDTNSYLGWGYGFKVENNDYYLAVAEYFNGSKDPWGLNIRTSSGYRSVKNIRKRTLNRIFYEVYGQYQWQQQRKKR